MHKIQFIPSFITLLSIIFLCSTAMAQEPSAMAQEPSLSSDSAYAEDAWEETDDVETASKPPLRGFWAPGFAAGVGAGFAYVHSDSVSSGYHYFEAQAAGFYTSIDIGYHWDYFAVLFNFSPRAAWAIKDAMIDDARFTYSALDEGTWDGYFLSVGVKADFYLHWDSDFFFLIGAQLDFPIGMAQTRDIIESQFRLGIHFGAYVCLSDSLAVGVNIGILGRVHNNYDEIIEGSLNPPDWHSNLYIEGGIGLIYHLQ